MAREDVAGAAGAHRPLGPYRAGDRYRLRFERARLHTVRESAEDICARLDDALPGLPSVVPPSWTFDTMDGMVSSVLTAAMPEGWLSDTPEEAARLADDIMLTTVGGIPWKRKGSHGVACWRAHYLLYTPFYCHHSWTMGQRRTLTTPEAEALLEQFVANHVGLGVDDDIPECGWLRDNRDPHSCINYYDCDRLQLQAHDCLVTVTTGIVLSAMVGSDKGVALFSAYFTTLWPEVRQLLRERRRVSQSEQQQ